MIYFKCKPALIDGELYGFVAPEAPINSDQKHFFFDPELSSGYQIHACDIETSEVAALLGAQHAVCDVTQVDFADIESDLKKCRLYKEINGRTVEKIRLLYDENTELSIMKLDKTDPLYVDMLAYISTCRAEGTAEKIAIGLKLPS